ncbi:MAG: pilus (MSHA type) biogenesis protein MshL [Thiohalomonadales bacterium]
MSHRTAVLEQYDRAIREMADTVETNISSDDENEKYLSNLPIDVDSALKPKLYASLHNKRKVDMQRRFDIKVDNLPVNTFLLSLVKGTEINIVPHADLEGNVSLDLKNVTIRDVLVKLSNAYGYDFNYDESGYDVYKPKLYSKIYHVDYLNIERIGRSQVRVSSGQVSDMKSQKKNLMGQISPPKKDNASHSLSGTEVQTTTKSSFWNDLHASIESIIGKDNGRSVVVNAHSGVIIVRAMSEGQRRVAEFLEVTQTIISRQVLLEAKIIEVVLSDSFQTGINWAALAGSGDNKALFGQIGARPLFNGDEIPDISNGIGGLDPTAGIFSMAIKTKNFAAFIEALETQGDVHVLSSPRVSTINNQKAIIKVGSDEFFFTDVTTQTVTNISTTQSINVELTPFFSGVALDVTPQINADDMVTLHVHPSVSKVTEKVKEISVSSSETFNIPLALSTIRESDSIVQARSGQVIVIGGLMQNTIDDKSSGIPFLGEIPIIGGLFRHQENRSRKSELIILLRPVVIKNSKQWDGIVDSGISKAMRGVQ